MLMRMETGNDMVCHSYRVQIGADFYNAVAVGNRYKIERYLKHELHASMVQWLRSFLCSDQKILSRGKFARIIGRDGFILKMAYAYPLSTLRSKKLNDKQEKKMKKAEKEGCNY